MLAIEDKVMVWEKIFEIVGLGPNEKDEEDDQERDADGIVFEPAGDNSKDDAGIDDRGQPEEPAQVRPH